MAAVLYYLVSVDETLQTHISFASVHVLYFVALFPTYNEDTFYLLEGAFNATQCPCNISQTGNGSLESPKRLKCKKQSVPYPSMLTMLESPPKYLA